MNITVTGTKVKQDTKILAFEKNNNVDVINITVDTDESWTYKLDVKYPNCRDDKYNIINLVRNANTLTVSLTADMLPFAGKYLCQLRGISGDKVYHTNTFEIWVKYSIEPAETYHSVPSEFYQIEENITEANNHPPYPSNDGYWMVWNITNKQYEKSDIKAASSKKDWLQNDSSAEDYIENRPGGYMTDPVETALWTGELKEMQDLVISAVPVIGDSAVIAIGDEIFTSVVEDGSAIAEGSVLFGTIALAELTSGSATEYVMFNALNYEGTPVIIQYATDSYVGKTASVTVSSRMPVKIPEKFLELDSAKDVFWVSLSWDNDSKTYVSRNLIGDFVEYDDMVNALKNRKIVAAIGVGSGESIGFGFFTNYGQFVKGGSIVFNTTKGRRGALSTQVVYDWVSDHTWARTVLNVSYAYSGYNSYEPTLFGNLGTGDEVARYDHQHPERTHIQFLMNEEDGEEKTVQCGDLTANVPYKMTGLDIPLMTDITVYSDDYMSWGRAIRDWIGFGSWEEGSLTYNACGDYYILTATKDLKNVSIKYKTAQKQDKDSQKYILAPYTVAPHLTFAAPNGLHKLSVDDAGNIRVDGEIYTKLPAVTADDNGKVLRVVDGAWTAVSE